MQITMFAATPSDVLTRAFFDGVTGDFSPQILAASSTQIRFTYPGQGLVTTLNGFGIDIGGPVDSGTVTGIEIRTDGGVLVASFADFSWPLVAFGDAMQALGNGDGQLLANLFNLQPVTIDASATTTGVALELFNPLVTTPVTVRGGTGADTIVTGFGNDTVFGGNGNDYIVPGGNDSEDIIDPGRGNDTVDGITFQNGFLEIVHADLAGSALTVTMNGRNGTINKGAGNGTTTLINFPGPQPGGYSDIYITGSSMGDVFNLTAPNDGVLGVTPGRGNDLINLGLSGGRVRINLNNDLGGGATQGAVVNLSTGLVANDGFGGQDTITGVGNVQIELHGTNHADFIIGSAFNDRFIPRGGNDTIDGGLGNDMVRYDRDQMTSGVQVDLGTRIATGAWNGVGFTHSLTSIEQIRGTRFADVIRGTSANERLSGGDGNDSLFGGDGNDLLETGNGDSSSGDDFVDPGRGNDTIDAWGAYNAFLYVQHGDLLNVGQTINIDGDYGEIGKGAFGTTQLWNLRFPQTGEGMEIVGSNVADSFDVALLNGGGINLRPGRGNDTIHIGMLDPLTWGSGRLTYTSDAAGNAATQGLVANLATGIIANDGFGFTDTVTIGEGVTLILHSTDRADSILGGDRQEGFILGGGNDTLDGGGGNDFVRYDRNPMTSGVQVDLGTGIATGAWNGVGFTHRLTSIEEIRGTRFDDVIRGTGANETLRGGNGNDSLFGGDGDDLLETGNGDTSTGDDFVDPGRGNDTIDAWGAWDSYIWVEHRDLLNVSLDVRIDGDHGEIGKGAFGTTQLWNLHFPQQGSGGLEIIGSNAADAFRVAVLDGGWISLRTGQGNDTIDLSVIDPQGWGGGRLNYHRDAAGNAATQGLVANLATGIIANDGFGFTDTVAVGDRFYLELRATDRADSIIGSDRWESFILQGGNDTLDGGGGNDRLRYDRNEMTSGVRVDLEAGRATGAWNGAAFTHRLTSIEDVVGTRFDDILLGSQFSPGNANGDWSERLEGRNGNDIVLGDGFQLGYATGAAAQVYRLYLATLDRVADNAGINGWTSQIAWGQTTVQNVAAGFVGSREFQNVYGTLDNAAFVGLMYQNVLDRTASQGEINAWLALMNGGQTRAQVALGFSDSQEFINKTRNATATFIEGNNAANWVDDIFRLYQATLGRAPDIGGLLGWADRLVDRINTLEGVAAGFVGSREFQNVYGTLGDAAFVGLMYQNVLGRTASQGEINAWLARIAGGDSRAQVVLGFSQSQEFINGTRANLSDWVRGVTWEDDIIIGGAGNNTLAGGMLSDTFVFQDWAGPSTNVVLDFEVWDAVVLEGFGYQNTAEALANFSQVGADVVFADNATQATFRNTTLAMFNEDTVWI